MLANATPCPEPPAGQEWACGPESLLGHATESAGLGSEPVTLTGEVLLTTAMTARRSGCRARPRGQAGPFDLGFVNVRSRIDVDPDTAARPRSRRIPVRAVKRYPTILKGVPAQLKADADRRRPPAVRVQPDQLRPAHDRRHAQRRRRRERRGLLAAAGGNCQALPFKPDAERSDEGKGQQSRRREPASSRSPPGFGQSNIAKTDLHLPKALPSRLTTIQKACVAATFEANPACCPEGSVIGSAVVHTPG